MPIAKKLDPILVCVLQRLRPPGEHCTCGLANEPGHAGNKKAPSEYTVAAVDTHQRFGTVACPQS